MGEKIKVDGRSGDSPLKTADLDAFATSDPLARASVSDEIANRLISSIIRGRLRFGDKLPAERDLATYFNVGRPSVREALKTLSVIGLIEVRHGEGAFVVDRHADFVAKAFAWVVLLDPATTGEIVEARIAIEGTLARLAAARRTDEDLAEMERCMRTMEAVKTNRERFGQADIEFHLAIANASRNKTLSRTFTAIRSLLRTWIKQALSTESTAPLAIDHHHAIFDAISRQDEAGAEEAMRGHLTEMAERIAVLAERSEGAAGPTAAALLFEDDA